MFVNGHKKLGINRIEMLIKIYISEIEFFPLNITGEKAKNVLSYIKALLFGIKHVSDFFYIERDLWNKPFILFYSLQTFSQGNGIAYQSVYLKP